MKDKVKMKEKNEKRKEKKKHGENREKEEHLLCTFQEVIPSDARARREGCQSQKLRK